MNKLHPHSDTNWLKCLFLTLNILLESKINISLCRLLIKFSQIIYSFVKLIT